ncbi:MAG: type I-C CRISPR-associated endonuclease Cas1c [Akkermansia sp.]
MKKHLNTLYISTDGTWLALDGETVKIKKDGKLLKRIPLHNIEAITSFGWDIAVSPQLMAKCSTMGINISMCNPYGKLLCRVSGFSHGNVLLRRQQYRLADNAEASLCIAQEMVAGKILNARTNLQRSLRDKKSQDETLQNAIRELGNCVSSARIAQNASQLLGVEGHAAECYFTVFPKLISNTDFNFTTRSRRPPKDEVNAMMSFVYSLLTHDCRSALEACGLDSAVGIYHQDRPGRPGLALDLMEEFRAPLADRLVLTLINRKQVKQSDFSRDEGGAVTLSDEARRTVLTHWQNRKQEEVIHPYLQEKMTIGMLPHIQARLLAQHIRGGLDGYPPMVWK